MKGDVMTEITINFVEHFGSADLPPGKVIGRIDVLEVPGGYQRIVVQVRDRPVPQPVAIAELVMPY